MTEKKQEFLENLKKHKQIDSERLKDLPDRGNVFWAAKTQSEELKREENDKDKEEK